jgi:hypothetical protein
MLPLASLACSFSLLLRTPPQNQPPCRLVAPSPRISMDILALRAQNLRSPPVHCKFHCKFHSVQYSKLSPKSFLPSRKMKNPPSQLLSPPLIPPPFTDTPSCIKFLIPPFNYPYPFIHYLSYLTYWIRYPLWDT